MATARKLFNLARMTSATTGTGTITLGAAVPGFLTFALAGVSDGVLVWYGIRDGNNSELGYGAYTASGTSLTRNVVNSTNSNNPINLSGSAVVTITPSAEALVTPDSIWGIGGLRNLLLNPGFALDLRYDGVSTAISDDTYSLTCWNILTQTASINVSRQSAQDNAVPYNIRLSQAQASAQRMGVSQIVEGGSCRHLRGLPVVLSGRVRISNSQAVRYAILEWTGTEDAVTSDVVSSWTNGTFTTGQFFNSTTLTLVATGSLTPSANTWTDLTELTGSVSASMNNLILMLWTEGTAAQNVTLDFANLQLERGTVATQYVPRSVALEESLCARFIQRIKCLVGLSTNTTTVAFGVKFDPPMRAKPTLAASAALSVTLPGSYTATQSSPAAGSLGTDSDRTGGLFSCGNFTGLTAATLHLMANTAGQYIVASAEL